MDVPLPTTLESLLVESQKLYTKVNEADFDDDADRKRIISRATTALESLQKGVASEAVFSTNEEVEEISTQVLPLLAADFYLGSLMVKLPFTGPESRLPVLERAESLLFKYLDTCERLDLFEEADRKVWQLMRKDAERSTSGLKHGPASREQKIDRFRRQKIISQKMKEIELELVRAEGKDCEDESEGDGMRRERSLLLLSSLAADALDELSGMSKEREMLEHLLKAQEGGQPARGGKGASADRQEDAPRNTGLEVTHISRVGGNLQIRQEEVRAAIFKPTVALPTMTVEEFGEIELERARRQQEVRSDTPSTRRRYDQLEIDGDEDDEELVEQATQHDREWDDWKDEHPRGSGNKANKTI